MLSLMLIDMCSGPRLGGSSLSCAVCEPVARPDWVRERNWRPNSPAHRGFCTGTAMPGWGVWPAADAPWAETGVKAAGNIAATAPDEVGRAAGRERVRQNV